MARWLVVVVPCQAPTMRLATADLPPAAHNLVVIELLGRCAVHRVASHTGQGQPRGSRPAHPPRWCPSRTTSGGSPVANLREAGSVHTPRATRRRVVGHARTTSAPAPARRRPRYLDFGDTRRDDQRVGMRVTITTPKPARSSIGTSLELMNAPPPSEIPSGRAIVDTGGANFVFRHDLAVR